MARPALRIEVPAKDQQDLRNLLRGGMQVRATLRALTLLRLADGMTARKSRVCLNLHPNPFERLPIVTALVASPWLFTIGNGPGRRVARRLRGFG